MVEPFAQDYLLAQRAAQGDARVQRQLASRLIARVRRAAHGLMGGANEADDAAQHALIEIVRSLGAYAAELSLEAWADRLAARSVVRFARAVRARAASADTESADADRPEQRARTLEELLRQLPSAPREALLLREAFALDVMEVAQLVRASTRMTREQLLRGRRSLYAHVAPAAEPDSAALPDSVERWFALRDVRHFRDARDVSLAREPARFDPVEVDAAASDAAALDAAELEQLEATPEVRKLRRELRQLAQFLEGGRFGRLGAREKKIVEGTLAAVRVSSANPAGARVGIESPREASFEPRSAGWVHPVSIGLCAFLVLGSFLALVFYSPAPGHAPLKPGATATHAHVVKPTVEALGTAQTVDRRARLQRDGKPLIEGDVMREGDVVGAATRPGCFVLNPPVDVCLSPGAEARIVQLGLAARSVELLSGRAVVSVEHVAEGAPFAVVVGDLRVEVTDSVFGVEIDSDTVVVRALRGTLLISADGETRLIAPAQSAIYHWPQHTLEVAPQLVEKARRDWDLLATRATMHLPGRPAPGAKSGSAPVLSAAPGEAGFALDAVQAPGQEAKRTLDDAHPGPVATGDGARPEQLLDDAKQAAREGHWGDAERLYDALASRSPHSSLAREALIARAELLAERLQRPAEALVLFDRYLASGAGPLDVRARYGRIVALRQLNRPADERKAVTQFLNLYRGTPQARVLLSSAADAESAKEPW